MYRPHSDGAPSLTEVRRRTAADWLSRYAHDRRAAVAVRRARDGEDGVSFRAADGVVWHLRRVGPKEG